MNNYSERLKTMSDSELARFMRDEFGPLMDQLHALQEQTTEMFQAVRDECATRQLTVEMSTRAIQHIGQGRKVVEP